jgi:hypothetical protein
MNHNDMTQQLHDLGLTGEEIRNVLGALDGIPESPQEREPIYADFAENTQKLVDAIARIDARTGKPETIAYREGSLLESELAARIGAEYLRGSSSRGVATCGPSGTVAVGPRLRQTHPSTGPCALQ